MDNSILEKVNSIEQPTLKAILLHIHQKLQSINGDLDNITHILDTQGGDVTKSDILNCRHEIKKTSDIFQREVDILRSDIYREIDLLKNTQKKVAEDTKWQVSRVNNDLAHNMKILSQTITPSRSKSNTKIGFRK